MAKDEMQKGIAELYPYLKEEWIKKIESMPRELLKKATELRFRCGVGCSISCGDGNYPVEHLKPGLEEMEELWIKVCRGAVYRFESQMENGYIPLPGGHRVGICGTYVKNESGQPRIRDITAMNFRICRDVSGIAEKLFSKLLCDGKFCSTLIVSEPCGGKTTLLTDLIRVLSEKGYRSAVVDERGEIAAVYQGIPQKKLGTLADILDGYPKPYGMMIALRTPASVVSVEYSSLPSLLNTILTTATMMPTILILKINSTSIVKTIKPQLKGQLLPLPTEWLFRSLKFLPPIDL